MVVKLGVWSEESVILKSGSLCQLLRLGWLVVCSKLAYFVVIFCGFLLEFAGR